MRNFLPMLICRRTRNRSPTARASKLVNALKQERVAGEPKLKAYRLMYADVVILTGLGDPPFSQAGGVLLFHLLSKLY